MHTTIARAPEHIDRWDRAIYAFLSEKQRRSGSRRTSDSYARMLYRFFGELGKTADQVDAQDVFSFAHSPGPSGREPSSTTIGARIGCLSSFYKFLIRLEVLQSNPCDRLERTRAKQAVPRGLSAEQVRALLAVIPDTPTGLRDRAIVMTLVLTGRMREEVLRLRAGDIEPGEPAYYRYLGKGGKQGRRELPRPAYTAIVAALEAFGRDLAQMPEEASLWPASNRPGNDHTGITSGTFYGNLRRYLSAAGLPPSGVHILRHTAAKLRREAGEDVEAVSRFLDHSSLAVTTTYLRRLEGQQDGSWDRVAEAIGV